MIVVLGSTNTDMVFSGAKFPVPGAPRASHVLNLAMLVLFVAGLACLVKAGA